MSLDKSKLQKVRPKSNGSFLARCPACAASGGDRKGDHLIVFPNGKFWCVANGGDDDHRKAIWRLAGMKMKSRKPMSPDESPYRAIFEVKPPPVSTSTLIMEIKTK